MKWVLRSASRFAHRVVVLVDSKVVVGAATKGRSPSVPLNRLLKRLAALCFAGGLVLHSVFIPTSHNPSDWPSRGGPESWPSALRRRSVARRGPPPCPGCGVAYARHPTHLARRLRGKPGTIYNCCNGINGSYGFDPLEQRWLDYGIQHCRHLIKHPATTPRVRRWLEKGLLDDSA